MKIAFMTELSVKENSPEARKDEMQDVPSPPNVVLQLFNNLVLLILMQFNWTWGNPTPKLSS